MDQEEMLDLVDSADEVIGTALRKECHDNNLRHRAAHVLLFNPKGELFVQKRSKTKDVYPGLFEGSLSGHVKSGESYEEAATRELEEEVGIKEHKLEEIATFKLRVKPEHEIVKVFMMRCDCVGQLSKDEVESGEFVPYKEVKLRIKEHPEQFTPSSVIALDKYEEATETSTH